MRGSGDIETRDYDLSGFTAIKASRFEVEITQSETYSVTVRADDNLFDRLDVRTFGDTLVLGTKPMFWHWGHVTLQATVTMPTLTGLRLSGAAIADAHDFNGLSRLDLDLSGASELRGRIAADGVEVTASGASRVRLRGAGDRLRVDASGASKLDLAELTARTAVLDLSGASRATVNVAEKIESIEASGASRVRYLGDPALGSIDTSGASRVTRT